MQCRARGSSLGPAVGLLHTGRLSLQTGQHTPGSKVVHLAASGKKREVWNRTLVRVHGNNANIPVIEQRSILCNWYRAHPYPANSSAFHTSCKQHLGLFIERGKGKKTNKVINKRKAEIMCMFCSVVMIISAVGCIILVPVCSSFWLATYHGSLWSKVHNYVRESY